MISLHYPGRFRFHLLDQTDSWDFPAACLQVAWSGTVETCSSLVLCSVQGEMARGGRLTGTGVCVWVGSLGGGVWSSNYKFPAPPE